VSHQTCCPSCRPNHWISFNQNHLSRLNVYKRKAPIRCFTPNTFFLCFYVLHKLSLLFALSLNNKKEQLRKQLSLSLQLSHRIFLLGTLCVKEFFRLVTSYPGLLLYTEAPRVDKSGMKLLQGFCKIKGRRGCPSNASSDGQIRMDSMKERKAFFVFRQREHYFFFFCRSRKEEKLSLICLFFLSSLFFTSPFIIFT
jgi:hypothetical protein